MKTTFKRVFVYLTGAMFLASGAYAQVITIGSGSNGSLGFNSGQAVAKIVNQKAHITSRTQPLTNYLPLINNGQLDFGFSNSVEAEFALTGTGNFKGHQNPNLRIVGTMFPLITGLALPADLNILTVADLKKQASKIRIASEYTGSAIIPYYIEGALANGNMTYDDFKKVPVSSLVAGMQALGEDLVDAALVSLNSGAGKKTNVDLRARGGLQYVSLDNSKEGIEALKRFLPSGSIIALKADENVPGLIKPANIISIPWVLVVNKDVPDSVVYAITKVIAENNAELVSSFSAFKRWSPELMAPASKLTYHPGALKYYKEANIPVGGQ